MEIWNHYSSSRSVLKQQSDWENSLLKFAKAYPDNHDGRVTHLERDILECEVKWA